MLDNFGVVKVVTHARVRLQERYNIETTKKQWGKIHKRMLKGEGELLSVNKDGRERRALSIDNRWVVFVLCPRSQTVITCLSKHMR